MVVFNTLLLITHKQNIDVLTDSKCKSDDRKRTFLSCLFISRQHVHPCHINLLKFHAGLNFNNISRHYKNLISDKLKIWTCWGCQTMNYNCWWVNKSSVKNFLQIDLDATNNTNCQITWMDGRLVIWRPYYLRLLSCNIIDLINLI